MQGWSKSINWFTRYSIGKTNCNRFYGLVTLKITSRSPKSNNSEPPPSNALVQVWSKSIHLFRRYHVGKPHLISFHELVTLKMRSRSANSKQFFSPSQPCIYESLVKIHPLIQKISRRKKLRGRDADSDGICTKNNMSPTLGWGDIIVETNHPQQKAYHCQDSVSYYWIIRAVAGQRARLLLTFV